MGGAGSLSAPLPPAPALDASPVSMPQAPENPTVAGAAASQTPPSSESGNAVSMAPPVFTLGLGGSTAIMARSRGTQSGALSSANDCYLPLCQVMVRPRDLKRFWDEGKSKVLEMGDWDIVDQLMGPGEGPSGSASTERNMISGAVNPGQVSASVPVTSTEQTQTDTPTFQGGAFPVQAFPVLRGNPSAGQHNTHHVLSWKAMVDLRDKVAKYGLGSSEVMQMIRVMNTDILAPYNIRHLAQVLFQPVQLEVFESNWNQFAIKVIAQNSQLIPQNPRCAVGVYVFTGVGEYTDPDVQAALPQLVLEQCQKTGIAALVKTIELAAPKQKFVTIVQGSK
ncbi:hypothetical protein HGM15179_018473 [Zosterops borbonicus]|uniref:Uncharacterized protein n=1 Tax=Zosterops borbonicus TaxID=364589 RepID=A0A8K1FYY7_9PASS|nr:hypothetical protein HGM15179_018473 [Zosterops borbonicus]